MSPDQAIRRLREVRRRQHKVLKTDGAYVQWLHRYMAAPGKIPASWPSVQKLERFLTDWAQGQNVAARPQNQAFNEANV